MTLTTTAEIDQARANAFAEKMIGTLWGRERAERMLREAGFNQIEVHQLAHDFQNYFYIVRR